MFRIRFQSSIILMIITIATVVIGKNVLLATVLSISLIGIMELYRTLGLHKSSIAILGYIGTVCYYGLLLFSKEDHMMLFLIAYLLVLMVAYVFAYPRYRSEQIAMVFFGLFYVSVMLSHIYRVRMLEGGIYLIWLVFICAWGSDTCAYLVGITMGKHKMPSQLSPKKSIEGCIGGVVGAALIGFIYATIFKDNITGVVYPQLAYTIIGACGSIISQIGDLAASAIKRNHEIKDFGTLIPGHGGILDRFDSIIFTAPIVYYLATFF